MRKKIDIQTKFVHSADRSLDSTHGTSYPIYQTASFSYETAEEIEAVFAGTAPGFNYSRASNPSMEFLENRVCELEDGVGAVAMASGLAAIHNVILNLAQSGDEIIASRSIFGGTYTLFDVTLTRCGITTRYIDPTRPEEVEAAITAKTKLIFVETIGNPKMDVTDIPGISAIAKKHAIPFVVDSTVTTPLLFQPKEHGVDLVVHSATKFMSGHGNAIGGIALDTGLYDWNNGKYPHIQNFYKDHGKNAFIISLRRVIYRNVGSSLSPFNVFLISMGLESLGVRMERQCFNALAVARFLESHEKVVSVAYPGLKSHPQNARATALFGGMYGGILSLKLGTKENCFTFINNLKIAKNATNLGDAKTLVIHPASTFCRSIAYDERQRMGVTDDLIRFSIGLEKSDDLIDDMKHALAKLL